VVDDAVDARGERLDEPAARERDERGSVVGAAVGARPASSGSGRVSDRERVRAGDQAVELEITPSAGVERFGPIGAAEQRA
jgi:hypothetical protein